VAVPTIRTCRQSSLQSINAQLALLKSVQIQGTPNQAMVRNGQESAMNGESKRICSN
jgi:hypothetical protein